MTVHPLLFREDLEIANVSSEIGVAGNDYGAKEKEEEEETEATVVMKCKKTDGKRWRCKRAANLPHSLCSYHLTQLRSYRARYEDQASGDHRKKSPFSVDSASNHYYYYSILGPWWGKRRGPIHGDERVGVVEEEDITTKKKKKKKKRVIMKRGRKPMKSRSLKSLL